MSHANLKLQKNTRAVSVHKKRMKHLFDFRFF